MISAIAAICVGIALVLLAPRISLFERRLLDKHPSTKVTGWSGTRKGVYAWRVIGVVLVLAGIIWLNMDLFRLFH